MPRPSEGLAKHVAGASVVFTLWLERTFVPPSEKAVPIHHTDYHWEVQCLHCLLPMSLPLHVLSNGTVLMTPR